VLHCKKKNKSNQRGFLLVEIDQLPLRLDPPAELEFPSADQLAEMQASSQKQK
jgi:hypothetical protein